MSTLRSLIEKSYRKCSGVIAAGETPSVHMMQDGLEALRLMLDGWEIEGLLTYALKKTSVTWPSLNETLLLGQSVAADIYCESLIDIRPDIKISNGAEIDWLTVVSMAEFLDLQRTTATSTLPKYIYINQTLPDLTVSLYPTPINEVYITFISSYPLNLSESADLNTELLLPQGYETAIIYNLAVELCSELGMEPSPTVTRLAVLKKRYIRRFNNKPSALNVNIPSTKVTYNIQTD